MKNIDSYTHLRGESVYIDDIPVLQGTLYAAVFDSPVAHGKLISLDTTAAAALPGAEHAEEALAQARQRLGR